MNILNGWKSKEIPCGGNIKKNYYKIFTGINNKEYTVNIFISVFFSDAYIEEQGENILLIAFRDGKHKELEMDNFFDFNTADEITAAYIEANKAGLN